MEMVYIVITLVVVGFMLWIINTLIPMARSIKMILNIVVVGAVILWLLNTFGVYNGIDISRMMKWQQ